MSFKEWAPLKLVNSELLSRVRFAYVFGRNGLDALIVTDEDEVLACGMNSMGCLGLKHEERQLLPINVPELSKKKVKGFSSSTNTGTFVCAYTYSGTFYYWGKSFPAINISTTPTMFPDFSKKVSDVVCGNQFCLILSTDGQVFSFGNNDYGKLGHGSSSSIPILVQGNLKDKIVMKISCGSDFSVCVLDNGEVYAWGNNNCNQLGYSYQSHSSLQSPSLVPGLKSVIIRKIICGPTHVLAINDVCELYSWGYNHVGQLGLGDITTRYQPTKIENIGKVINIAATAASDSTSVAMTENFEVYMWGACGGLNLTAPTLTEFETLHEVFTYFADPRIMYKPMSRHFQLESVSESIKYSFGNAETSDLTIVAEDKEILVHKVILKLRSNYFRTLLQEPWVKEDDKVIKINQNYDGVYAYLQYIYSGDLKTTPEVALELMRIADEYNDLVLKKICEKSIRHGITVENVASLYSLALKLGAKKLANYCMVFASNHVGEVIKTAGFSEWDKDTYKEFILECHRRKIFRSSA